MQLHLSILDPRPLKKCSVCKQIKPLSDFHLDSSKKDGHCSTCKPCACARARTWQQENSEDASRRSKEYYQKNKERIKRRVRTYVRNNPELIRQRKKEYGKRNAHKLRAYREKTKERRRKLQRQRYLKNRDKPSTPERREYMRLWMRIHRPRRLARRRNFPDDFTQADYDYARHYFNYCCAICGCPEGLFATIAMDHWIPLSSKECIGTIPANMVPMCHGRDGCNNSKHNRNAKRWLISKFGNRKAAAILARVEAYFETVRQI